MLILAKWPGFRKHLFLDPLTGRTARCPRIVTTYDEACGYYTRRLCGITAVFRWEHRLYFLISRQLIPIGDAAEFKRVVTGKFRRRLLISEEDRILADWSYRRDWLTAILDSAIDKSLYPQFFDFEDETCFDFGLFAIEAVKEWRQQSCA